MSESDGKRSDKVTAKRSPKLVLPPRASRPSDDAFFNVVLSSVEKQADEGELESALDRPSLEPDGLSPSTFQNIPSITAGAETESEPVKEVAAPEIDRASHTTTPLESASTSAQLVERSAKAAPTPSKPGGAGESLSFQEFEKRWTHFLSNTLLNVCKEIHKNTVEQNRPCYDTTARELCEKVGKSKRHTFLLLQQLEMMGFVRRKEIKENNRLVGIRIWFHVVPLQK